MCWARLSSARSFSLKIIEVCCNKCHLGLESREENFNCSAGFLFVATPSNPRPTCNMKFYHFSHLWWTRWLHNTQLHIRKLLVREPGHTPTATSSPPRESSRISFITKRLSTSKKKSPHIQYGGYFDRHVRPHFTFTPLLENGTPQEEKCNNLKCC